MKYKKWLSFGIGLTICTPFLSVIDNYKEVKMPGNGSPGQTEIMVQNANDSSIEKYGRLGYWVRSGQEKWYMVTSAKIASLSGTAYFENEFGLQKIGNVIYRDSQTGLAIIDTNFGRPFYDYVPDYDFEANDQEIKIVDYMRTYEELKNHKDNLYLYAGETNKLTNLTYEGYEHAIGFVVSDKDQTTSIHDGDVGSPIFYYDESKNGYIYAGNLWEKSHLSEWKYLMTTVLSLPAEYIPYTANT